MDFPLPLTLVLMMDEVANAPSVERAPSEASRESASARSSGIYPAGTSLEELLGTPRVRSERVA